MDGSEEKVNKIKPAQKEAEQIEKNTEEDDNNEDSSVTTKVKKIIHTVSTVAKKALPIAASTVPVAGVGYVILMYFRRRKTIVGVVTENGEAAEDCKVMVFGNETNLEAETDDKGRYAFKGLNDDVVTVVVYDVIGNEISKTVVDLTKSDESAFTNESGSTVSKYSIRYKEYHIDVEI